MKSNTKTSVGRVAFNHVIIIILCCVYGPRAREEKAIVYSCRYYMYYAASYFL